MTWNILVQEKISCCECICLCWQLIEGRREVWVPRCGQNGFTSQLWINWFFMIRPFWKWREERFRYFYTWRKRLDKVVVLVPMAGSHCFVLQLDCRCHVCFIVLQPFRCINLFYGLTPMWSTWFRQLQQAFVFLGILHIMPPLWSLCCNNFQRLRTLLLEDVGSGFRTANMCRYTLLPLLPSFAALSTDPLFQPDCHFGVNNGLLGTLCYAI